MKSQLIKLRTGMLVICLLVGIAVGTAVFISPVHATDITVTTTDDEVNNDGDCSLREAVIAANGDMAVDACPAGNGADTIILPAGEFVFSLAGSGENAAFTGDLDILDDLTIIGAGPNDTYIDANGLDRVFELYSSSQVRLVRLTARGGNSGGTAGGNTRLTSGTSLTLEFVRISDTAVNTSHAFYALNGSTLNIYTSRIENNLSGGISAQTTAVVTVYNSSITGNINTNTEGGGISSSGTVTLVNSTLSGNSAGLSGGAIVSSGTLNLYNVTIAQNTAGINGSPFSNGGGIYSSGTAVLRNSIIAYNELVTGGSSPDFFGDIVSEGYNIIKSTTGYNISGNTSTNMLGQDPLLDALSGNGGGTFTHPLLAGSPAINAGNPGGCRDGNGTLLTTDQRAYQRNGVCDIGAYEANSPGPATATPTLTATATNTLPPTSTATATQTATATPTKTVTPTPTATSSATPTKTATATAVSTQTATPTGTSLPPTMTSTPLATATGTPTGAPTSTPDPVQEDSFFVYLPMITR